MNPKNADENLENKLREEIDKASWSMLDDHFKRGAVILVKSLDLARVGVAVALDDSSSVKLWLDNGDIVKVDEKLKKTWEKSPDEKNFQFLIVQPYVFIQLLGQ